MRSSDRVAALLSVIHKAPFPTNSVCRFILELQLAAANHAVGIEKRRIEVEIKINIRNNRRKQNENRLGRKP